MEACTDRLGETLHFSAPLVIGQAGPSGKVGRELSSGEQSCIRNLKSDERMRQTTE